MEIRTMKDIIDYAADRYEDNCAIKYKVKKEIVSKTYCDIKKDSETFSRVLESLGMPEKHVAVIGKTSYPWIISYFGTVNSRGVAVPVDAQLPKEDIWELLDRADVSVLVFDEVRKDVAENIRREKVQKRYCPMRNSWKKTVEDSPAGWMKTNFAQFSLLRERQGKARELC